MKAILYIIPLLLIIACQSPSQLDEQAELNQTTTATLHWTGEVAADGCGFEVEINGKRFLPENEEAIPETYKQADTSQVQLVYQPLEEPIDRRCGMLPQPRIMPAIRILSVKAL